MSPLILPDRRLVLPRPDWDARIPDPTRRRRSAARGRLLAGAAAFTFGDVGGCNCATCTQTITVTGCNALPLSGWTVQVQPTGGGAVLASGTTDGSGRVTLTWTGGGSVQLVVPATTRFTAFASNVTLTCGGSHTIALLANVAAGYQCMTGCAQPVSLTLHATDAQNGLTPTLTSTGAGAPWIGTATVAYPACAAYGCPAKSVPVKYTITTGGLLTVSFPVTPGGCPDPAGTGTFDAELNWAYSSIVCPPSLLISWSDPGPDPAGQRLYCNAAFPYTWSATE